MDAEKTPAFLEYSKDEPSGGGFKPPRWAWGCAILFALVICAVVVGAVVYFFRDRTPTQATPTLSVVETIGPWSSPTLFDIPTATETGTATPESTATPDPTATSEATATPMQTAKTQPLATVNFMTAVAQTAMALGTVVGPASTVVCGVPGLTCPEIPFPPAMQTFVPPGILCGLPGLPPCP